MTDHYLTSLNAYVDGLLDLSDEVEIQRTLATGELPVTRDSKTRGAPPHNSASQAVGGDLKISRSLINVRQ